ncbi:MAG: hypothetical protein IT532_07280 [Burkholderiales bacterium]|nr:hypothetical protein [Burkholderiales bacterium]
MAKDSPANRQQMRHRIAHIAARMIAEDGISDYGLAKRKAARQAGAPDSRNLPDNAEIEEALRAYQDLYQADEQTQRVLRLRELALDTMRLLEPFEPHLTGSVLSGAVSRHGDIHLQLYADSSKDVEIFLLNRDVPFRNREVRVWAGDCMESVPDLVLTTSDATIHLMILSRLQRRMPLRLSADGRPLERASIQSVEALLAVDEGRQPS